MVVIGLLCPLYFVYYIPALLKVVQLLCNCSVFLCNLPIIARLKILHECFIFIIYLGYRLFLGHISKEEYIFSSFVNFSECHGCIQSTMTNSTSLTFYQHHIQGPNYPPVI